MQTKTGIRAAELALLALLAALLAWGTALERQQQRISGSLIRMHVVANSDTEADQAEKLAVRDAVLEQAGALLTEAESREEAAALLRDGLPALEQAANRVLATGGADRTARVTLARELFGTRNYDGFSLPGGYYDALRVTIGSGGGKNWWCVVYPQICTAATAEDRRSTAVMGGLRETDLTVLEDGYSLRFRSLELLEDLLGWFRGGEDGIPVSR